MLNHEINSPSEKTDRRSSLWAAILSFFLPGCGQIFCRQDNKGVLLLGIFLLGHWMTTGISSLIICPAMSLDAFMIATKSNRGLTLERWEFFPAWPWLNKIPKRVIFIVMLVIIALITVIRVRNFAFQNILDG